MERKFSVSGFFNKEYTYSTGFEFTRCLIVSTPNRLLGGSGRRVSNHNNLGGGDLEFAEILFSPFLHLRETTVFRELKEASRHLYIGYRIKP